MVYREFFGFLTAILANKTVPEKHFLPGKSMLLNGAFDHIDKPDNRWNIKGGSRSMNLPSTVLQHFCFTTTHEAYCPTNVADVQSFVVLI